MHKTTVKIKGMACPMCEKHVNEAITAAFSVNKVTSSHKKGETVMVSVDSLDAAKLTEVIADLGYTVLEITDAPYKKSLFGRA